MPSRLLRDWTDSLRFDGITAEAERLFTRLIMKADDYGRFHAEPRLIKANCFPLIDNLRPPDILRWLDELSTRGLILRYETDGRSLLAIVNYGQRLKQSRAKFPPKPGEDDGWLPVSVDFREVPGTSRNVPLEEKGREDEVEAGGRTPPMPADSPPPPSGGSRRITKARKAELTELVMSLRPGWKAMGDLQHHEEKHFELHLHILDAWPPDLWTLLREYLAAPQPEGSGRWQPTGRGKFLETPGDLVPHAMSWDLTRTGRKRSTPDNPNIPAPFIDWLASNYTGLNPRTAWISGTYRSEWEQSQRDNAA